MEPFGAGNGGVVSGLTKHQADLITRLLSAAGKRLRPDDVMAMQQDIHTLARVIIMYLERAEELERRLMDADQTIDDLTEMLANESRRIRADAIENARTWLARQAVIETGLDAPTIDAVIGVLIASENAPIQRWDREEFIEAIQKAAVQVEIAREKQDGRMDYESPDDAAAS